MIQIDVRTTARRDMVDVTAQIQRAIAGLDGGDAVLVWVPHTTAAVVVNENADPDVRHDLLAAYEAMVPGVDFRHAEGNSDAHLLATLLGTQVMVPLDEGRLRLGTWQGIYLVELDGPRSRRLWLKRF